MEKKHQGLDNSKEVKSDFLSGKTCVSCGKRFSLNQQNLGYHEYKDKSLCSECESQYKYSRVTSENSRSSTVPLVEFKPPKTSRNSQVASKIFFWIVEIGLIIGLLLLAGISAEVQGEQLYQATPFSFFLYLIALAGIYAGIIISAGLAKILCINWMSNLGVNSALLGGLPGGIILFSIFFMFPNMDWNLPLKIFLVCPLIFGIFWYQMGYRLFQKVENMKPVGSKIVRFLIGSFWTFVASIAGVIFAVLGFFIGFIVMAILTGSYEAPAGYVWASTGTKSSVHSDLGTALGIAVLFIVGFVISILSYSYIVDYLNKITLRTIGHRAPSYIGEIVVVITLLVFIARLIGVLPSLQLHY